MAQRRIEPGWKRTVERALATARAGDAERLTDQHEPALLFALLMKLIVRESERRHARIRLGLGVFVASLFGLLLGAVYFQGEVMTAMVIVSLIAILWLALPLITWIGLLGQNAVSAALHMIATDRVTPSVGALCTLLSYEARLPSGAKAMLEARLLRRLSRLSESEAQALDALSRKVLLAYVAKDTGPLGRAAMVALAATRDFGVRALLESIVTRDGPEERRALAEECLRTW